MRNTLAHFALDFFRQQSVCGGHASERDGLLLFPASVTTLQHAPKWVCHLTALRSAVARSNLSAVVGPVQQRLSLSFAAHEIAGLAMPLNLADMALHRLPSLDLATILIG